MKKVLLPPGLDAQLENKVCWPLDKRGKLYINFLKLTEPSQ